MRKAKLLPIPILKAELVWRAEVPELIFCIGTSLLASTFTHTAPKTPT